MDKRLDFIFRRRSIRKYTSKAVSKADIKGLLEAGASGPSACNFKPWSFIVITGQKTLNQLSKMHEYSAMLAEAPLAIVVCGNRAISQHYWVQDCAAAAENILLAAEGLGLGAVWLGCHPRPERKELVREILSIPESIDPLCVISIGHPGETKEARTQLDSSHVHHETW